MCVELRLVNETTSFSIASSQCAEEHIKRCGQKRTASCSRNFNRVLWRLLAS